MQTLLDPLQKNRQIKRLRDLRPLAIPSWGILTPGDLLPHLTDPFRIAMGELEAKPPKSFFSTKAGKFIAIYLLPRWPEGAPTHPKTDITKEGRKGNNFDQDMRELIRTIDRFVVMSSKMEFNDHPIFGKLSNNAWGIVMNKHLEHHFRQFRLFT